jgi:hypothetical protein
MSIAKRKRLKAKRAPWAKTRIGRRAYARSDLMRSVVFAQGQETINAIRLSQGACNTPGKLLAIAEAATEAYKAAAMVPVYGAKTV